jgi:nitrite reductase/ring-hydroxylating ferredoxin subunit
VTDSSGGEANSDQTSEPSVVKPGDVLCRIDALDNPGSRGFTMLRDGEEEEIFVVRDGDDAFAYVNVCPHRFLPLNWKPDVFLNFQKTRILCVVHAATFDLRDGSYMGGPCPGQSLESIPLSIEDGVIRLAAETESAPA